MRDFNKNKKVMFCKAELKLHEMVMYPEDSLPETLNVLGLCHGHRNIQDALRHPALENENNKIL